MLQYFSQVENANYLDRLNGVQMVNHLLQGEPATQYLKQHWQWQPYVSEANVSDIPFIVELIRLEILPTEIRDKMYKILLETVPQFENLEDAYELTC